MIAQLILTTSLAVAQPLLVEHKDLKPCFDEKMLPPSMARSQAQAECTQRLIDLYMHDFKEKNPGYTDPYANAPKLKPSIPVNGKPINI